MSLIKLTKSTGRRGSYLIKLLILIRVTRRDSAYRWHPDPSFYHCIRNITGREHSPQPLSVQNDFEITLSQCRMDLILSLRKDRLLFHLLHSYLYLFIINILIIPTHPLLFLLSLPFSSCSPHHLLSPMRFPICTQSIHSFNFIPSLCSISLQTAWVRWPFLLLGCLTHLIIVKFTFFVRNIGL